MRRVNRARPNFSPTARCFIILTDPSHRAHGNLPSLSPPIRPKHCPPHGKSNLRQSWRKRMPPPSATPAQRSPCALVVFFWSLAHSSLRSMLGTGGAVASFAKHWVVLLANRPQNSRQLSFPI